MREGRETERGGVAAAGGSLGEYSWWVVRREEKKEIGS